AISSSTAAHRAIQWNASMRAVFGETSPPGQGLIMKGFKTHPRKIQHLTPEEFAAMIDALPRRHWQVLHHRELICTYLEVAWCAGARIGSLLNPRLRVGDADLEKGVLRLNHVKNRPSHDVVLSDRAIQRLRWWLGYLERDPHWRGRESPLFMGPRQGRLVSKQFINRALHDLARLAGTGKPVTTHVIRKSVGTLMALVNPKLAQEQLGITEKVFHRHYNQPLLEDRLAHREVLPGVVERRTPEAVLGSAYLRFLRGEVTQARLDEVTLRVRLAVVDPHQKPLDAAYV
ncbi:MAG TPA: tyrosine-type recombinase/integrase, partial [Candidatus Thermoplasmatota archaeon]|nr:tyrosine-type recombinase/integrase [Candidatus Thermoplasmatota archaeon]